MLFTYVDENENDIMTEFNIIRAKQYSYKTIKNKDVKKLKGIHVTLNPFQNFDTIP